MATSKQKTASQRNGRLSRGPKTDAGKRAASLNAIRHGLSARPDLNAMNPHIDEIEQLILAEVPDALTARAIAGKIIDYERTEAALLEVAAKEALGEDGFVDQTALDHARNAITTNVDRTAMFELDKRHPALSKTDKKEIDVFLGATKFLMRFYAQQERRIVRNAVKDAVGLRRYYKRASNQLIKAIKAVC